MIDFSQVKDTSKPTDLTKVSTFDPVQLLQGFNAINKDNTAPLPGASLDNLKTADLYSSLGEKQSQIANSTQESTAKAANSTQDAPPKASGTGSDTPPQASSAPPEAPAKPTNTPQEAPAKPSTAPKEVPPPPVSQPQGESGVVGTTPPPPAQPKEKAATTPPEKIAETATATPQDQPAQTTTTAQDKQAETPATTDKAAETDKAADTDKADTKAPDGPPKQEAPEADHTVKKGETLVGIARQALGPNASVQEVLDYANKVGEINNIGRPERMQIGTELKLPGQTKDGTYTYVNPQNKDEHIADHADGSTETHNTKDGTSSKKVPFSADPNSKSKDPNSYTETHSGPKPEDNYQVTYTSGDHLTIKKTNNPDGGTTEEGSDGSKVVTDKNGNWDKVDASGQHSFYDKNSNVTTETDHDGTITKTYGVDGHTESYGTDGTKVSKYNDGSYKQEHTDENGQVTTKNHYPNKDGSYTDTSTGPNPKDNYTETYDSKTGTTVREEAKGTDEAKTTTRTRDGKITEETKDGIKDVTPKPGDWTQIDKAKQDMNDAVKNHIPADKQAQYRKDMADFEARAKASNMPPEEVAKTYEQMSKMLNGKEEDCTVSGKNRAKLAESFMHQCAHPDETDQGKHNTCNETAVAERGLTRNPSKMAEIAATTAMTGQWVAPDGKVIKIDKESLTPGKEEEAGKPAQVGDRSYATQVLNVAMVNDVTQRRSPPEFYHQIKPDASVPGDTGERLTDESGNALMKKVVDPKNPDSWISVPRTDPFETDYEINQSAKRILGQDCVIDANSPTPGVDNVISAEQLAQRVQQAKDQGQLPLIIGVDCNHAPITENEQPGFGGHVVTIDKYDPNRKDGKTIHISNQYGKPYDKWVSKEDLYKNSNGDYSDGSG